MGWKTKRAIGTLAWALVPYLAWSFITLDLVAAFSGIPERAQVLAATVFFGAAAYTYPGWKW